jgi:NADPH-dependent 2,4-dienoyl-CoA reductase/sulfur reductase-like enzyme
MSVQHVKYLLIGGGIASSAAARAIRALDSRGDLLMVGLEKSRPYNRPPLSKDYLRRQTERQALFDLPAEWFSDNHVMLRTGLRASQLDVGRRIVTLESGEGVSFDKLLLATGAAPVHLTIPGGDFPNVHYLRTLDDADRLHHAVEKAAHEGMKHPKGRGRAAVIGGGVLGVELAATFTQLGLAADLFLSQGIPWNKFAGDQTGKFLVRYLEKRGVTVHPNARPLRLEGDGRARRVVTDHGEPVACDFVAAAVGAVPNRQLLRGTPIAAEKAILCDVHCRTTEADIYAAGDCAAVFDPLFGKHRFLDHWDNARVTGQIAGTNMAGGDVAYNTVNNFFSDVFELSLNGWGEARQVDRRLIRGSTSADAPDFVELGIAADGRIAQVLAVSHSGEDELLRDLVARRVRVDGNEEALKDPSVPLASLLG